MQGLHACTHCHKDYITEDWKDWTPSLLSTFTVTLFIRLRQPIQELPAEFLDQLELRGTLRAIIIPPVAEHLFRKQVLAVKLLCQM